MERRYSILRQISLSEPVGRRTLSNILDISERVVRSETEFLKEQGLIDVAVSGMTITYEGIKLFRWTQRCHKWCYGIIYITRKSKK